MKNLQVLENKILIVQVNKKSGKTPESLFAETEVSDSIGEIIGIGDEYKGILKVGDKVLYGPIREPLRVYGKDVISMESNNVVAIVIDEKKK